MRARALFVDPDGTETLRDVQLAPNNAYPRRWKVGVRLSDTMMQSVIYKLEEEWEQTPAPRYGDPMYRQRGRRLISRRYVRASVT